jgi:integrase/recombinase XerD
MQQSTINKVTQRFKEMVNFAVSREYIPVNPFLLHKPKTVKKDVVYLTSDELKAIEEKDIQLPRVSEIRDCIVFCCYTGLAFEEMTNLRRSNIISDKASLKIQIVRLKTGKQVTIPIFSKTLNILQKYEGVLSD